MSIDATNDPVLDAVPVVSVGGAARDAQELLRASRPFAEEKRANSWWCLWTTFAIMAGILTIAALAPWWPAQLAASLIGSLVMVRGFILYHDFLHGAILRKSWLARAVLYFYGYLLLVPASSWRKSHNFHHAHVGKPMEEDNGSFPVMTTATWRAASRLRRLRYRITRHPLTMLSAYLTVFAISLTLDPLVRHPGRHWDAAVALTVHGLVIAALCCFCGFAVALFAFLLPVAIAGAVGAYLFYVQHNYAGMRVLVDGEWRYQRAVVESSCYLKLGRLMKWFTGDIGYHHVHHLNAAIPFYRLAETMAAIPELQQPVVTTLHPRDILACLRLKLWNAELGRMVGYGDAGCADRGQAGGR